MNQISHSHNRKKFSVLFNTPEETIRWMHSINGPHGLKLVNPNKLKFKHHGSKLGNIASGVIEYSTAAEIDIDDLKQNFIVNIPLRGEQSIELKGKSFLSTPESGVIISPSQSMKMAMTEDCRKQMVSISRQKIESKISKLLGRNLSKPVIFKPGFMLDGSMKQWWSLIQNIQEITQNNVSLYDIPEIWSTMEETLITGLVYSQDHNYYNELLDKQVGRPAYLRHLESMMRDSINQPLRLDDLERSSGVSRDRLYKDFNTYFNMSPIAYFRQLRLDHAHQRLTKARPSESVSSIAMDCGFQQLGRFSQEYRVRFGELPSKTLNNAWKKN
ncbi:AraC family transcriptional regulator [Marinobacterium aestuariivivens]|uniref:AraC family transcriptional regulator n=1 Tax=Marinobacterium aestuariivivens TaxID=1698799 RepID=A0ABW2A9Q2_9GAMM